MYKKQDNPYIKKLIKGCLRGNEASQMALYRHFYGYGLSLCLRYSSSRESAMEVLNDGFLKVFTKIELFDQKQDFKPWLRSILIRTAIDHHRKHKQKLVESIDLDFNHPVTSNEIIDQMVYKDLLKILQQLPPVYRMVFNLFKLFEFGF